jgi:signal transduction histidine kinase
MRRRMADPGGTADIEAAAGQPTRIRLALPIG